ncbi:MAG: aldose 1-epimerase [Bryobacteraceae bacterium]|nr:aldose 1-epimerase [Bryobacteraceae bacterium]MDW8379222.1 aldose 1-epimerase [Bryobacterales bacterium]
MTHRAERQIIDGTEVVCLTDKSTQTEVRIAPSFGNNSYDMKVAGQAVFWCPYQSLAELKAKPAQVGNPFLAPWANRLDQNFYWANGRKYLLNPELKNFRYDAFQQPIHGLLVYAPHWQVTSLRSGDDHASVTSRLEFWRYPDWMAQFPFAHVYEMTYRLAQGQLEVETVVENLSSEPMPLSIAYHGYFTLPGSPRDAWAIRIPAREHVVLNSKLTPTGERKPFPASERFPLHGRQFDDVFTSLDPGSDFVLEGPGKKIAVRFGEKWRVGVVYAPSGRDFVCFEPMSGLTNAFNLAHAGKYDGLQKIAPGGQWRESFWIKPSY